jgi:hypothetical protein
MPRSCAMIGSILRARRASTIFPRQIQPSGHLGFIQFGLSPRPKRARGYFRMMVPHPPDGAASDIQ